jgi:TonB family protein
MTALFSVLALVIAAAGAAQDSAPMPSGVENPYYPDELERKGVEAWALLSIRITRAGAVDDAFVTNSSGHPAAERTTLAAVKRWRYAPRDADLCGVRLRLSLQQPPSKIRASAEKAWSRFDAAFARGDFADAGDQAEKLDSRTLREHSIRELMRARLAHQAGDMAGFLDAASRVDTQAMLASVSSEGRAWEHNLRQHRLLALVALRQYGAAIEIASSLRREGALASEVTLIVAQLDAIPSNPGVLETPGVLRRHAAGKDAPSYWTAPLTRGRFRLDVESGEITRAELCCEKRALEFAPGTLHDAPKDAGVCRFQIRGSDGARFTVTEPPTVEATPSALPDSDGPRPSE